MTTTTSSTPTTLTPSQIVLLNGECFTTPGGKVTDDFVISKQPVRIRDVATAAMLAALLALEARHGVTFELRPDAGGRGRSNAKLVFVLADTGASYPTETFEGWLESELVFLTPTRDNTVKQLATTAIVGANADPWWGLLRLTRRSLWQAGLMEMYEERSGKFFKSTVQRWRAPPKLAPLLAANPWEPVKATLSDFERGRPELWKAFVENVERGLRSVRPSGGGSMGGPV